MSHGEHVGLEFDGLDAPSNTLDPVGVSGSSGVERTVGNQGTSLRVHEQSDIPALASGSSDTRLFGRDTNVSGQARAQSVANATTSPNPYTTASNPSQFPASGNGLMPWTMLPSMYTDSDAEPTLSFVAKKPKIAEVVPGHSANPFISRE